MSQPIRNLNLCNAFRKLSREVCRLLASGIEKGVRVPAKRVKKLKQLGNVIVVMSQHEPDLPRLASYNNVIIERLPQYKQCLALLEQDGVISQHFDHLVGAFNSASRLNANSTIREFIGVLLNKLNSVEFAEPVFLDVYLEMERFFYSSIVQIEVFAPLEGFQSKLAEIDLGGG